MKNMISIANYSVDEINEIFSIADELSNNKYKDILNGKTVVMFFPENSIRTRVSFEKGIHLLGGQTILFPTETLDKKEDLQDVIGYLNNWADVIIVRHKNIEVLKKIVSYFVVKMEILEKHGRKHRMSLVFSLNSVAEKDMKLKVLEPMKI